MYSQSPTVVILLATHNGAKFLESQLESFRRQTYSHWELLVSDDGSTDATLGILQRFSKSIAQRVVIVEGPHQGFWRNFEALVRSDRIQGELFAYSDQDDVWFDEKLSKAVDWFRTSTTTAPALYFTRTQILTRDGQPAGYSPLITRAPSFRNALIQNIGGGNTMVFNASARGALLKTPVGTELVSHDWWTYQVVTGVGGVAHYDAWPSLGYRQHSENLVGANTGWRARSLRLQALSKGRLLAWNEINLRFLHQFREALTLENLAVLQTYAKARRSSLPVRLWLLWKSGVYRHSALETIGIFVGSLFSRI